MRRPGVRPSSAPPLNSRIYGYQLWWPFLIWGIFGAGIYRAHPRRLNRRPFRILSTVSVTPRRRYGRVPHQFRNRRVREAGFSQASPKRMPEIVPVQINYPRFITRPSESSLDVSVRPVGLWIDEDELSIFLGFPL